MHITEQGGRDLEIPVHVCQFVEKLELFPVKWWLALVFCKEL